MFGFGVFAICALISYKAFRRGELKVYVKLAKVQFRDELPRTLDTEGRLDPVQKWDVELKKGGKLTRYLVNTGDVVKKDQIIALLDEDVNKTALESALNSFKREKGVLQLAQGQLTSRKMTQKEYDESQSKFYAAKSVLELAKQRLEDSLISAPFEGRVLLKDFKIGDSVTAGTKFAEIEDWSKSVILITVPESANHEIPNHARVFISLPGSPPDIKPIESFADVHATDLKANAKPNEATLELVLVSDENLNPWHRKVVHLNIPQSSYKRVALVERRAIVVKAGESKIPVLNPYGFLHWQKIDGAPVFEDKIVIRGVDAKSFRVVIPDNPDLLSKAITYNVKPKVENGG
jgi:RND family efflux transporter MFP subunit